MFVSPKGSVVHYGWKQETGLHRTLRSYFPLSLFWLYKRLQKLHHLSERVACATDNCKNVVNHFVSIKLTCIIIITEKHVYSPFPKMCTWRTPVYHVTKLSLFAIRRQIIQLYCCSPSLLLVYIPFLIYNGHFAE